MTFSWRYFERVATYYHALMLTFLAGLVGFFALVIRLPNGLFHRAFPGKWGW